MTFADFCHSIGLIPPRDFIADDRWHPCGTNAKPKSKNGRYNLSPDGRSGAAQDWQGMDKPAIWREGDNGKERTAEQQAKDNAALSAKLARRREDERRAILRARAEYRDAEPLRGIEGPRHPTI